MPLESTQSDKNTFIKGSAPELSNSCWHWNKAKSDRQEDRVRTGIWHAWHMSFIASSYTTTTEVWKPFLSIRKEFTWVADPHRSWKGRNRCGWSRRAWFWGWEGRWAGAWKPQLYQSCTQKWPSKQVPTDDLLQRWHLYVLYTTAVHAGCKYAWIYRLRWHQKCNLTLVPAEIRNWNHTGITQALYKLSSLQNFISPRILV